MRRFLAPSLTRTQKATIRILPCTGVIALALLFSFASHAAVIAGLPAAIGSGNCIPFGCALGYGVSTFQEIYSASIFTSPITIGGIDFFNTQQPGGMPDTGTYTFSLSYSSKLVDALDLTNPANNISSGSQMFFSGPLPTVSNSMMSFKGTPFRYDPALGNLLLTVGVSGAVDQSVQLSLDANSTSQTEVSRAWFGATGGGNDSGVGLAAPLVTQFDPVPEPTTIRAFVAGLLALTISDRTLRRKF